MLCLYFFAFICHLIIPYILINKYIIEKFKYGKTFTLGLVFFCGIFFAIFRNAPIFDFFISQLGNGKFVFTLVFFVGFLCSFFHIFEFGSEIPSFQKIKPFLAFALLFACIGIRWIRAYDAVYCKYDAFITAPIVYSIVVLCNYIKPLASFLQKLGKYSTYMWLTHTFFCFDSTYIYILLCTRISHSNLICICNISRIRLSISVSN